MVPERAARYALFMLTIAYVFNFIDRKILVILPPRAGSLLDRILGYRA